MYKANIKKNLAENTRFFKYYVRILALKLEDMGHALYLKKTVLSLLSLF